MADEKTSSHDTAEMVLTVIAQDRPGLVERLAEVVLGHGGNWIDSSMARLGGEFAGILRVSIPRDQTGGLEAALAALSQDGIDVTPRRDAPAQPPTGPHIRLELTGIDHPGIVLEVTRALRLHGISIDELQTAVFSASMTGQAMFSAKADLVLPQLLVPAALRDVLERIANDLMVDIELAEPEPRPAKS